MISMVKSEEATIPSMIAFKLIHNLPSKRFFLYLQTKIRWYLIKYFECPEVE